MNNRFPNRRWCIINSGDVSSVNFSQVLESSAQTCRYSVDGSKTFVKYEGTQPSSVASITGVSSEYTHSEILAELATEEWSPSMGL